MANESYAVSYVLLKAMQKSPNKKNKMGEGGLLSRSVCLNITFTRLTSLLTTKPH